MIPCRLILRGYEYGYALALQAENDREKALEIAKQGIQKNPFDAQLKLLASQLSYELHQPEQAEAYLLEAKEVADDLEEIALRLTTFIWNRNALTKSWLGKMKKSKQLSLGGTLPVPWLPWRKQKRPSQPTKSSMRI